MGKEYGYCIVIKNITQEQEVELKSHFEDFSWQGGFSVTNVEANQRQDQDYMIHFSSEKGFDYENEELENNLVNILLGKEQFVSNLFFTCKFNDSTGYFAYLGQSTDE